MKIQPMALVRIAVLALLAALPFQAAAQAQPPVGPAADDLADLAGLLVYDPVSLTGMLHVVPGEEQAVLEVLGASPIGPFEDRKYKVGDGKPPVIIGIAPDLDPTWWEDLVNPDDDQVWIFRNRVCTENAPAQIQFCQPDGNGQFTTLVQLPNRECERTASSMGKYCFQNPRHWSTREVWKDDQCTILDRRDTEEKFTCGN
jgi:hypothetical protein